MRQKLQAGDLVYVDCPGALVHFCFGVVVAAQHWPPYHPDGRSESDYRVLLSNPPDHHPAQIMLRDKWLKILSKKMKKVLDFSKKNGIIITDETKI